MVYHLPVRPLTHRLFSLQEGSYAWVWLFLAPFLGTAAYYNVGSPAAYGNSY